MKMLEDRGFTLLEVLVATAIMALALGALFPIFSSSYGRAVQLEQEQAAREIATTVLNRVISVGSFPNLPLEGEEGEWSWQINEVFSEGGPVTDNGHTRSLEILVLHKTRSEWPGAQLNHVFWVEPS